MEKTALLWRNFFPQLTDHPDPSIQSLIGAANLATLPAGKTLFYPGSPCQNYVLVVEGEVRVHLIAENGREVLLYRVSPGETCILTTSCLLGKKPYPAEGVTETNVTAFVISHHAFGKALDQSPFFRKFVFDNFADRLSSVIARMEEVVFEAIEHRLARVLLQASHGRIETTHQNLATDLGTAREVISRHLKRFERYGWISLNRGVIEVNDPVALERILEME